MSQQSNDPPGLIMPVPKVYLSTTSVWSIAAIGIAWQAFVVAWNWPTFLHVRPFPTLGLIPIICLVALAWLRIQAIHLGERREAALDGDRRRLVNRLLQAEEEERARIASELHDDTIQVMIAALMMLDQTRIHAERLVNERADECSWSVRKALLGTDDLLRGALERTRNLTFEMAPTVLNHHGLAAGIEALVNNLANEMPETQFTVRMASREIRYEPAYEAMTFRLIREILINVRKHSEATWVDIGVEHLPKSDKLEMTVLDNGVGFDVDQVLAAPQNDRQWRHLGLASMIERVRLAGGDARVTSAPGATVVRIVVPVSLRQQVTA